MSELISKEAGKETDGTADTWARGTCSPPRISIVTPSLNQANYLERTILSVLGQDYPNLEYIIIDGGSTDGSVDIIRRYSDRLAYWVSEPDTGQAAAINKGFRIATGDILAWLNADDEYEPNALWSVGRVFAEHPDIDVVYGNTVLVNTRGETVGRILSVPWSRRGYLYGTVNVHQPSTFWRRALWERVGGVREDLHYVFDGELFERFVQAGATFLYLSMHLTRYRLHDESKTVSQQRGFDAEWLRLRSEGYRHPLLYCIGHPLYRVRQVYHLLRQGFAAEVLAGIAWRLRRRHGYLRTKHLVGPRQHKAVGAGHGEW